MLDGFEELLRPTDMSFVVEAEEEEEEDSQETLSTFPGGGHRGRQEAPKVQRLPWSGVLG